MTPLLSPSGQNYWQASRSPRYSLVFAAPLLILYELLAILLPVHETQGVRNGAEVIIRTAFDAIAGPWGAPLFGAVMIGASAWFVSRDVQANGAPGRTGVFALMMVESILLAAVFAVTAAMITARVLGALHLLAIAAPAGGAGIDAPTRLMVSLGAGIFEELLFRVVLVSTLMAFAKVVFGAGKIVSAAFAVILSALIFSAFHYIGPFGDKLALPSFLFRAVAGLLFSLIYVLRGFGIAAWTHSLYDVGLLLIAGA
jgi:hypothetical protein